MMIVPPTIPVFLSLLLCLFVFVFVVLTFYLAVTDIHAKVEAND